MQKRNINGLNKMLLLVVNSHGRMKKTTGAYYKRYLHSRMPGRDFLTKRFSRLKYISLFPDVLPLAFCFIQLLYFK